MNATPHEPKIVLSKNAVRGELFFYWESHLPGVVTKHIEADISICRKHYRIKIQSKCPAWEGKFFIKRNLVIEDARKMVIAAAVQAARKLRVKMILGALSTMERQAEWIKSLENHMWMFRSIQ